MACSTSPPGRAIVDAVAVHDGGAGDLTYGVPVLGVSYDGLPYAPGGASRIPDGLDTDAATDWVRNDFDLAGIPGYAGTIVLGEAYNTPGAPIRPMFRRPRPAATPTPPSTQVQGSGLASPLVDTEVAVEGIVVGDFQNNASAGQREPERLPRPGPDGRRRRGHLGRRLYLRLGRTTDVASATGCACVARCPSTTADRDHRQPGLGLLDGQPCPRRPPSPCRWPASTTSKPYEGMLVTFPQALVISEYFNFDRYGEIVLTSERSVPADGPLRTGVARGDRPGGPTSSAASRWTTGARRRTPTRPFTPTALTLT